MNSLLFEFLGCLVLALSLASSQKVKWCVNSHNELNKCKHLTSKAPELECVHQPSVTDCMKSIGSGGADVMTADGEHVYYGGLENYKLKPIIAEKYKKECCYAVAVVKKNTGFTINELTGKTSCHSCYKSSGGWNIPIGKLVSKSIIKWEGPDDKSVEKAVSEHFSAGACVPGISKTQYPKLCQACKGDCSCSSKEDYHGDDGAFRCLKNDEGKVAFVCHNAIPVGERQNYELLCQDGSRKSVDDYKSCHLGKEPAVAVIIRKDDDSENIYKILQKIPASDLFSSEAFGGKDLILSDSASGLDLLPKSTDSFLYLGEEYYENMRALKDGPKKPPVLPRDINWCTVGHLELQKCDNLKIDRMMCRSASSVDECIKMVKRGDADAFAADGGQVYIAGKCGLVPVMVEQYNEANCLGAQINGASSYYVVAVVHKGSGVTWKNLKGKKSCHTGLDRNAGWKVPKAVICLTKQNCNLYDFFSKGCAPGADPSSNMCELCKGSGKAVGDESKCKASAGEMYYGYDGAFRCLAENAGEVAFIKHTIVPDYTDGKGPAWAKDLLSDDFELICPESPDKTEKISDFEKCNLALVPAHAVVTRDDVRDDVVSLLKDAEANGYPLFKSEGGRNLLFSDSTKCLQEIKKSTEEFLTKKYINIIEKNYETDQREPDLLKACTLDNCKVEQ
ncbi:transferrin-a [Myxocyprinus asiaticus]|uniref:transferrin-a n=1 Tax=Myxocyprinus asiaticus TaxID=70543 RepID=UPI0022237439|nr:transferrin-a [Myxocyprinus asiaticus]